MDSTARSHQPEPPAPPEDLARRLAAATSEAFEVESIRHLRVDRSDGSRFGMMPNLEMRGRLLLAPERAYDLVASNFRALGHVALFRKDREGDVVLAVPGALPTVRSRPWIAIGLFVATLLSVLLVGVVRDETALGGINLLAGLPFAASLLGILLAHEFGHYLVARRLGVPASLPYFIPLPISPFGTMGAMIQMKAPPRDRRRLFAVAIAGPLAGLVVAIPVLVIGLLLSPVQPLPVGMPYAQEGNSLLYIGIKFLLFGRLLPSGGEDISLYPMAFAGWAGLFVTGLNLIPASQLDGGHIIYAVFGERARIVTHAMILAMLGLGILWQGWLLWAALIFFFRDVRATPLDDITPLRPRERALAIAMVALFVLTFTPIPLVLH